MNTKKLVYAALSGAASVAFVFTPAIASTESGASNNQTGADSYNNASVSVSNDVNITQGNTLVVTNSISINSNTGGNKADKNTGSASISTGDANASVDVSTSGNSNELTLNLGAMGDPSASNSKTGADSWNKAKVDVDNDVDVSQLNMAVVTNDVDAKANTGKNEANKNTGDASIDTGDSDVEVTVSTDVNNNDLTVDGLGSGDLSASNEKTGADSWNKAKVDVDNNLNIKQGNTLLVDNEVDVCVNTGKNEANKNTGGEPSIDTGDADVMVSLDTTGNSNEATVDASVDGDWSTSNSDTGYNSDNKAKVDVDNDVDVSQLNNAVVTNDGDIHANAGWNKADKNTGDAQVSTGDTDVEVSVSTDVNSNALD